MSEINENAITIKVKMGWAKMPTDARDCFTCGDMIASDMWAIKWSVGDSYSGFLEPALCESCMDLIDSKKCTH